MKFLISLKQSSYAVPVYEGHVSGTQTDDVAFYTKICYFRKIKGKCLCILFICEGNLNLFIKL